MRSSLRRKLQELQFGLKSIVAADANCCPVDGVDIKGARLAAAMNRRIDAMADGDNEERQRIIRRLASGSGSARDQGNITASTVNQILRGDINCPPLARLRGFARVLGVSADSLIRAARSDGCNYTDDD